MSTNVTHVEEQITQTGLPAAAQRWLRNALPGSYNLPAAIRLEQEGELEVRGRWTPFKAQGLYQAAPLAFEWQARLQMMPGLGVIAEDGHRDGQGWGGARMWGIFSLGKKTDPEVLASQLVRNLGELAWLPGLALSSPGLIWTEAGENAFEVRAHRIRREAVVRFEVTPQGDILRACSPARPYDVPGGFAEAPWCYEFSEHRAYHQVRLPARAVATFQKPEGEWEYFRCQVTAVQKNP